MRRRCHLPAEQARTCYYLSRPWHCSAGNAKWLCSAPAIRSTKKIPKNTRRRCDAYKEDLESFRAKRDQYIENKEAWESQRYTRDRRQSLARHWSRTGRISPGCAINSRPPSRISPEKQAALDGQYQKAEAIRDGVGLRTSQAGQSPVGPRSASAAAVGRGREKGPRSDRHSASRLSCIRVSTTWRSVIVRKFFAPRWSSREVESGSSGAVWSRRSHWWNSRE